MSAKLFSAAIAAAIATTASATLAFSAPNGAVPGRAPTIHQPRAPGVLVVNATTVAQDNPVANIAPGATTFETANVKCAAKKCILAMSAMDQIGLCDANGGWAIEVYVDGNLVNSQYQGPQPTSSIVPGFQIGNWQGFASGLAKGTHQVQFQTYVEGNCIQDQWAIRVDSANYQ